MLCVWMHMHHFNIFLYQFIYAAKIRHFIQSAKRLCCSVFASSISTTNGVYVSFGLLRNSKTDNVSWFFNINSALSYNNSNKILIDLLKKPFNVSSLALCDLSPRIASAIIPFFVYLLHNSGGTALVLVKTEAHISKKQL